MADGVSFDAPKGGPPRLIEEFSCGRDCWQQGNVAAACRVQSRDFGGGSTFVLRHIMHAVRPRNVACGQNILRLFAVCQRKFEASIFTFRSGKFPQFHFLFFIFFHFQVAGLLVPEQLDQVFLNVDELVECNRLLTESLKVNLNSNL